MLILDACVLIDFLKAAVEILKRITYYVGPLYVAGPTLEEVRSLCDEAGLVRLGVTVIWPDIEDVMAAVRGRAGPTSFQDRICARVAGRNGFFCVTNDSHLRDLCALTGVPCWWGLELLTKLHRAGGIEAEEAIRVAERIRESNPRYIKRTIVERFAKTIRLQAKGKGK